MFSHIHSLIFFFSLYWHFIYLKQCCVKLVAKIIKDWINDFLCINFIVHICSIHKFPITVLGCPLKLQQMMYIQFHSNCKLVRPRNIEREKIKRRVKLSSTIFRKSFFFSFFSFTWCIKTSQWSIFISWRGRRYIWSNRFHSSLP